MKYRELQAAMATWTDEQLDSDITIEVSWDNECYPAELRIADEEHDSLDENHPIIYASNLT